MRGRLCLARGLQGPSMARSTQPGDDDGDDEDDDDYDDDDDDDENVTCFARRSCDSSFG